MIGLAEQPGLDLVLEYLADLGARQVRPHLDLLGDLDAAEAALDERAGSPDRERAAADSDPRSD